MPRFFVDEVLNDVVEISGDDAGHISRSLRMKTGDEIIICCDAVDYQCVITQITGTCVTADIKSSCRCAAEPDITLTLYQAVPKLDKFDMIIQKCIELGAAKVVPVITKRCVSRPDSKDFSKKLARYNRISLEAAKQSGRGIIPQIMPLISCESALKEMAENDCAFILYEKGGIRFSETDIKNSKTIALFTGSEGGFEEAEVELAKSYGVQPLWLGNRILRCETAPLAAAAVVMFLTENL